MCINWCFPRNCVAIGAKYNDKTSGFSTYTGKGYNKFAIAIKRSKKIFCKAIISD